MTKPGSFVRPKTAIILLIMLGACASASTVTSTPRSDWKLTWSDEFDGAAGATFDRTKWVADTGGQGWGNQEREYYTADLANAQQAGGSLVITATTAGAAGKTCWYGACKYTSARLQTKDKFAQAYGRFEAMAWAPR